MKNFRFLTFVLTIATLLLSACGATTSTATPAAESAALKVDAMPVTFVGIVDSIAGDQWVISGTTVTVDASIVRDGPFKVGDRVKVEGFANPDGSLTVSRVENPTPQETATLPPLSDDNSNDAINANTNDSNINDDGNANINDDNSNASNSNDSNINDDNGGANTNDDNSNDSNVNDDNGGGNTNDDNSNDDHGGNSNDDNSGGGGNDNGGGDDNGSGGNGNDD